MSLLKLMSSGVLVYDNLGGFRQKERILYAGKLFLKALHKIIYKRCEGLVLL